MVLPSPFLQPSAFSPGSTPANVQACEVIFGVNVIGTLLCYKYAAKQMVKQGSGGRIIGIFRVSVHRYVMMTILTSLRGFLRYGIER